MSARRYLLWGMEISTETDTDEAVDYLAGTLIDADIGKYKPSEDLKGVALCLVIRDDEQAAFNQVLDRLDMGELQQAPRGPQIPS